MVLILATKNEARYLCQEWDKVLVTVVEVLLVVVVL